MKRESIKMQEEDFQRLTEVAAGTSSIYSGAPSWRRLVLRIARGEVHCKEATKPRREENVKAQATPTGTEAAVCTDIARRQQLGVAKYGTTVAANPLPLRDWLQHAYEECLDQAIYLRRAIDETDPCAWHDDEDGIWHTACGNSHVFISGTPRENKYQHCPYCGHAIK